MKHVSLDELQKVAEIANVPRNPALTRSERMERWAHLLDQQTGQHVATLAGTEYQPEEARAKLRVAGSAISIAFADPVFRADGLSDDTYGEARHYFGLSNEQLHEIVCHCHYGALMTAETAAGRVRSVAGRGSAAGILARVRYAIGG